MKEPLLQLPDLANVRVTFDYYFKYCRLPAQVKGKT